MGGTYQPSSASTPHLFAMPSRTALWWTLAVLAAIAAGAALRVWAASIGGNTADVSAYRDHIELAVRNHQNIYSTPMRFPYFPGWLYVEELVWHFSEAWRIDFWWLIRLVIVAADIVTCFAVWFVASLTGGAARGRWAAAIYALSPIAILISGTHGQFDAFPTLFSILAAGSMLSSKRRPWAAGLLLGVGIALKPSPALLLPAFLLYSQQSWRDRVSIVVGACIVPLIVTAPYLLANAGNVYRNVVGYQGLDDQGLGGLMRAAWMNHRQMLYLPGPMDDQVASDSRFVVFALVAFTLTALWRQHLGRVCAGLYLAFLAVYGGLSSQYLVWPLAWLLISDVSPKWEVVYSIGAAAGAFGFYYVFFPQLVSNLPNGTAPILTRSSYFLAGEIISFAAIWLVFLATLWPGIRLRQWRNPLLWVTLAATILAFIPIAGQIQTLYRDWNSA